MAAPRKYPLHLVLIMAGVPLFWLLLDSLGLLSRLKNMSMDWRFNVRGQIPAIDRTKPGNPPLKVVYVDIDAILISSLGERPWPREAYAYLMDEVLTYGHAKAVGLDFVLSPAGMKSKLIDQNMVRQQNHILATVMQKHPNAILAAVYSNVPRKLTLDDLSLDAKQTHSFSDLANLAVFPYIYDHHTDPKQNAYPESPSFPVIGLDYGTVGLIDVATQYSVTGGPDNVPRWIPLFAETEGPDFTLNLLWGILSDMQLKKDDVLHTEGAYVVVNPATLDAITLKENTHKVFYNISVDLALSYLGLDDSNVRRSPEKLEIVAKDGKPLITIPLTDQQLVEVNWFTKWKNPELNPRVSSASVLNNANYLEKEDSTPEEKAAAAKFFEIFRDAIVLIGPVDPILQDLAPTPFDSEPVPKVSVYGNLLKTFFSGDFIKHSPRWLEIGLQFVLTFLVASLAIYSGHHSSWAKFGAVAILLAYIGGVFAAFSYFTLVLPLILPTASALTTAFVGVIVRLIDEEKQKKRIKGMFGTYLAPEVVNDIVNSGEEPQLGGHAVSLTCFFSDVQGFSTFSEVMTPEKLVDLMNEFLTAMTDILQSERGSLDKYIGDAIVAMYGAPVKLKDDALRACVAACRMQKRLGELRQKWIDEGEKWPERVHKMRMRIGLNTGEAIVGNMGSTSRFNYTMMGDSVNLAARLESGAKHFGVYTMCSEDTKKSAEQTGSQILFRRLNKIRVKGKTQPVEIYEVVCFRDEAAPDTLKCVELFEKALELYMAQKWDEAKALFAEAEKLEPLQPGRDAGVAHNPSELMQEWCDEKKADPPPADWDGVETMTEK